jgi:hypothetical protein
MNSPSSKAIGYPPIVAQATLLTEVFFLNSAEGNPTLEQLRRRFGAQIARNRTLVPYPIWSLNSSTLDEYILESESCGELVILDDRVSLTAAGRSRLVMLQARAAAYKVR